MHIHLLFKLFPPWPQYFESLLQEVEEDTERESSLAIEKASNENPKLLKLQKKLDKGIEQKRFLDEVSVFYIFPSRPILRLDDIFFFIKQKVD